MSQLKPWPADSLVIVASRPERANTAAMDTVEHRHCQECGAEVLVDGSSLAFADAHPYRFGRPVSFLCLEVCYPLYDFRQIQVATDMRHRRQWS